MLQVIELDSKNLKNHINGKGYSIFLEGCKDFDKLKDVVGVSCISDDGEVIVLKDMYEGSDALRPNMFTYPKGTFVGEAGHFIKLCDMEGLLDSSRTGMEGPEIRESLEYYTKHLENDENIIIMAF